MKSYERRLIALEAASPAFADVLKLIRRGARYDELDDQQKSRYCSMIGTPQKVYEGVELAVVGDLHGRSYLNAFDSMNDTFNRSLNNHAMIRFWDSLTQPIVDSF